VGLLLVFVLFLNRKGKRNKVRKIYVKKKKKKEKRKKKKKILALFLSTLYSTVVSIAITITNIPYQR